MCQMSPFVLKPVEVLWCMSEKKNYKDIFNDMHFI